MALAVGLSFLAPRLLPLALAVALFFWPVRRLTAGRLTRRTPVDGSILLLLLLVPVTLWATALPNLTRPQVLRLLTGMALLYAVINWTDTPGQLRWVAMGFILINLLIGLLAPFSVLWIVNKFSFLPGGLYDRLPPLLADTAHPNVMAGTLVILAPILTW